MATIEHLSDHLGVVADDDPYGRQVLLCAEELLVALAHLDAQRSVPTANTPTSERPAPPALPNQVPFPFTFPCRCGAHDHRVVRMTTADFPAEPRRVSRFLHDLADSIADADDGGGGASVSPRRPDDASG